MRIEKNYIKSLTNSELKKEWIDRGYEEYRKKIGKVAGLGWDHKFGAIINNLYAKYRKAA